jgi:cysteine synthase A
MQGWTPDFIPKITGDAIDAGLIDEVLAINGADAMKASRDLAQKEGMFVGVTSGATLAGALDVCKRAPAGSVVLCMLPDTGERYLTTPLFEGVSENMTDEELEISRSTPSARFDVAVSPAPAAAAEVTAADAEAVAFVQKTLAENKVALFALEWCEFCWSVRKLFNKMGLAHRSVDLDSAAYQKDDWGGRIRAALREKTGCVTIPQIFVGGEFIGGCSELFDAYKDGKLQAMLDKADASYAADPELDPYQLLPKWLQPRPAA